jgi:mannose-1-phosphate guanylyltransferase
MAEVAILSGGVGSRLWPASSLEHPKQFLPIPGEVTLLEQAVERAKALVEPERIWIVTHAEQVKMTRRLLPDFEPERILAEPAGRNSGPAATAITLYIEAHRWGPTPILVTTADHLIPDVKGFAKAAKVALARAAQGKSFVTFGLKVREPRTDFGYIEAAGTKPAKGVLKVARFHEKPALTLAKQFAKSRKHFWNSGLFAWRSDFFKKEMEAHAPEIFHYLANVDWKSPLLPDQLIATYQVLPEIAIDYALFEKSRAIEMVPASFAWSDVGTWWAVHQQAKQDQAKNALLGPGRVVEGKRNLIYAGKKPIALLGVDDLVVVDGPDALLVTTRERSRGLKEYLPKLKKG